MYKILRIIFCLAAVACAAVTIFIFVYFGFYGIIPLAGAVVFAVLMLTCKNAQEDGEKESGKPGGGDFITGKAKNDDGETENDE